MESPSAARASSVGVCERWNACSMRPAASGIRADDSAAPRSSRIPRRSAVVVFSSSARRRNRTAWSGEPRAPALSRGGGQRLECPCLTDGSGGSGGEQVGRRPLAASRVAGKLARGGQMELRPLRWWQRVLERLLDDRMDEPRRKAGMEELGLDQRVDRARRRAALDARDVRGIRHRRIVAEDRQRSRDNDDRRRTPAQPRGDEPGHRRRAHRDDHAHVKARGRAVPLLERGDELTREQRVPTGRPGAFGADRMARIRAEAAAHELGDGRRAERLRPDRRQRLVLEQLGEGVRSCRGLVRPQRENHAGRDLFDPRLQVGEESERLLIGPVRVVDDQGERLLFCQPHAQPVQAVEPREQPIVCGRSVGYVLEKRARQPGGAREGLLTLAVRERLDARRQELDDHTERELALQHAAACAEHGHTSRPCE